MRSVVTGGGGFLGLALVKALRKAGDDVVALGRGRYAEAEKLGAQSAVADIRDRAQLESAFRGADRVFHVAARVGIWGPWAEYHDTNVTGTENVLHACRVNSVPRLIFTSSPSVTFDGLAQRGIDETAPYPTHWLSPYPRSKAMAEERVLAANGRDGLHTVALRPHLIWGEGDRFLLPRVISQAREKKLVRVGPGTNLVDITHVDDAAEAHLLAAEKLGPGSPSSGKAYFLSSGEPVVLWDFIAKVLAGAGAPAVTKAIPFSAAYAMGALLEKTARKTEPRMTRFLAHQLAKDHYYSIEAARRDFGYAPRVTVDRGLNRYLSSIS